MPNSDALAVAIAERDVAWRRYAKHKHEPTLRSLSEFHTYQKAASALRAICPHDRSEDRGYGGASVCCLCGAATE